MHEPSSAANDEAWRTTMQLLGTLLALLVLAFLLAIFVYWQIEGHEVLTRERPSLEMLNL